MSAFFTVSGVVAWSWLAWRASMFMRSVPSRLRWALWGHNRPQRYVYAPYRGKRSAML